MGLPTTLLKKSRKKLSPRLYQQQGKQRLVLRRVELVLKLSSGVCTQMIGGIVVRRETALFIAALYFRCGIYTGLEVLCEVSPLLWMALSRGASRSFLFVLFFAHLTFSIPCPKCTSWLHSVPGRGGSPATRRITSHPPSSAVLLRLKPLILSRPRGQHFRSIAWTPSQK